MMMEKMREQREKMDNMQNKGHMKDMQTYEGNKEGGNLR